MYFYIIKRYYDVQNKTLLRDTLGHLAGRRTREPIPTHFSMNWLTGCSAKQQLFSGFSDSFMHTCVGVHLPWPNGEKRKTSGLAKVVLEECVSLCTAGTEASDAQ
jgi:hypothetical protein